MDIKNEAISEQFDLLPTTLRQLIVEFDLGPVLDSLRGKYSLHVDQIGIISEQLMLTMVGLASVTNFTESIRNKTGVSSDTANLITYDLNRQVFSKIREELEKVTAPDGSVRSLPKTEEQKSAPEQRFDQKMGGVTSAPKQEVEVKQQTSDNKIVAPTTPPRDPYREPI